MSFDTKKFDEIKIQDRTEEVPVPELEKFFGDGDDRVWIVRALGGLEMAEAREAQTKNKSLENLIEGLLSGKDSEKVDALKETLGLSTGSDASAPDDYVWRVACLRLGSVDPKIDQSQAVRLALMNGNVFYKLTHKILQLSGMGKLLGE